MTTIRKAWAQRIERGHTPTLRPVRAQAADDDPTTAVGSLYLYDPIGSDWGISPAMVVDALSQLGDVDEISLHINSPGGDVFDAMAILNTLRQHPARVVATVDGIAASAASVIAAGADVLMMAPQSMLMIHDAWGMTIGNAADHRDMADTLDRISDGIAAVYADKSGGDAAIWRDLMREETWYDHDDAVESGLADGVLSSSSDAAEAAAAAWQGLVPSALYQSRPAAALATVTPQRREHIDMPDTTLTAAAVGESTPPAAAAPTGLQAAAAGSAQSRPSIRTMREFCAALAAKHGGTASREILNVLQDITQSAVGVDVEQPDFVGQLWSGVRYQRKVVPLIAGERLTSFKVSGWRWTTKPVMAPYTGDKADVPSNPVGTEPADTTAQRLAGAHDIDRKFVDFGDSAFFEAYYAAMAESYAILSDAAAVDAIEAAATDFLTPTYTGFLGAIAYGVQQVSANAGADSTFVLANSADLIPWALGTTQQDLSAFLDLIGVDPSRITHHPSVTAGHVIVGTREAIEFRELGETPIRVEAVNMVKGGVDAGAFGYYATLLHDADGLADVTIDTTP